MNKHQAKGASRAVSRCLDKPAGVSSGVAANCASALAQMAAASCVQEEREEKEAGETGDAIAQGTRAASIRPHDGTCLVWGHLVEGVGNCSHILMTFDLVACVNLCVQ